MRKRIFPFDLLQRISQIQNVKAFWTITKTAFKVSWKCPTSLSVCYKSFIQSLNTCINFTFRLKLDILILFL